MVLNPLKWDAHYGQNLIPTHMAAIDSYVAVTSPSAWKIVEPLMPHPPLHVEFQGRMGEGYLEPLPERLPNAEYVVAIGGGNALDVGKYAAWNLNRPLIMIPTLVSTGAVFQPSIAIRRAETWNYESNIVAPEFLLLDTDVIRAAPARRNRGGMGECIAQSANVGAWKWWSEQGHDGPPFDQKAADTTMAWIRDRCARFQADLDSDGQPQAEGIRIAAEINRERYDLPTMQVPSRGLDHAFIISFEWVHRREINHSEGVSLGTLMNDFIYGWGFDEAKDLLDSCGVSYKPRDLGCTWDEVHAVTKRFNELHDLTGGSVTQQNWFHKCNLDETAFTRMAAQIDA